MTAERARVNALGDWLADHVAPVAVIAVALALMLPSPRLAGRSDLLLAVLVLSTAAQIDPRRLRTLRRQAPSVLALSLGSLLVLTLVAWALSRAFSGPVRNGILSLGLASTEVASVGLIGLAGGDAVLAIGVLTASLIASAILGPLLAPVLAPALGHGSGLHLLGRFSLVVLLPLAAGLLLRGTCPHLARTNGALNGVSALTVCVLLYASLSAVTGGARLAQELISCLAFMLAAGAVALAAVRLRSAADPAAIALTTWLRDFAVAAALATQAFGAAAGSVAGIYGAVMLLTGTITATVLRRRASRGRSAPAA